MISLSVRLSKGPKDWNHWWVRHHDYLTDVESSPIEADYSKRPTEAYSFANVGEQGYFAYGGDGGITGLLSFSTHYRTFGNSNLYIVNIDTNFVMQEGRPWEGWKPLPPPLGALPWLPSQGPPLPTGIAPPWPWVWFNL